MTGQARPGNLLLAYFTDPLAPNIQLNKTVTLYAMSFKSGMEDNKSLKINKCLKFLFSLMCWVNSCHYEI